MGRVLRHEDDIITKDTNKRLCPYNKGFKYKRLSAAQLAQRRGNAEKHFLKHGLRSKYMNDSYKQALRNLRDNPDKTISVLATRYLLGLDKMAELSDIDGKNVFDNPAFNNSVDRFMRLVKLQEELREKKIHDSKRVRSVKDDGLDLPDTMLLSSPMDAGGVIPPDTDGGDVEQEDGEVSDEKRDVSDD